MRILIFGDSITQGFTDSEGGWEKKAARLRIRPEDIILNDTHFIISLYKNNSGGWEGFYNYANR